MHGEVDSEIMCLALEFSSLPGQVFLISYIVVKIYSDNVQNGNFYEAHIHIKGLLYIIFLPTYIRQAAKSRVHFYDLAKPDVEVVDKTHYPKYYLHNHSLIFLITPAKRSKRAFPRRDSNPQLSD